MHYGRCHCQQVSYVFDGNPFTCYACHCTNCQRSSGSAFSINLIVKHSDLSPITGTISSFTYLHNNRILEEHHCSNCGTTLWYDSPGTENQASIQTGTFDDPSWCTPVAHIWQEEAVGWLQTDDATATFLSQPSLEELVALWQVRLADNDNYTRDLQ